MEIVGHQKFEIPEVDGGQLLGDVLDCDVRLRGQPYSPRMIRASNNFCHRSGDDGGFTGAGRSLTDDVSVPRVYRQNVLDGTVLRGIEGVFVAASSKSR